MLEIRLCPFDRSCVVALLTNDPLQTAYMFCSTRVHEQMYWTNPGQHTPGTEHTQCEAESQLSVPDAAANRDECTVISR